MADLLGVLTDRMGNISSNSRILARENGFVSPSGDSASGTTDAVGNYELTVANTNTKYDLFVNSEDGGITGANFAGTRSSSGSSVSSFTLYTDAGWLIEHYGATFPGTHTDVTADSVTVRTGGYYKSDDAYLEQRLGSDTAKFWTYNNDSVSWFVGQPVVGADDLELGVREKYDASDATFYFGQAKTYYVKTDGSFVFGAGTISGAVTASGAWTVTGVHTFNNSTGYPLLDSYAAPSVDAEFAPKKYVDDEIVNAFGSLGSLTITDYIIHDGDSPETKMGFPTADKIDFIAGGVTMLEFVETTQDLIEFNSGEVDIDFIINASSASNAFYVEGSTGNIGVGTIPDANVKFHIKLNDLVLSDPYPAGTGFVIEDASAADMYLTGADLCRINFGNAADRDLGEIRYVPSLSRFEVNANAVGIMSINDTGVRIGDNNNAVYLLHVQGEGQTYLDQTDATADGIAPLILRQRDTSEQIIDCWTNNLATGDLTWSDDYITGSTVGSLKISLRNGAGTKTDYALIVKEWTNS